MSLRAPSRHFDPNDSEFVDRPDVDPAVLRDELETLEMANRRLGAYQLMLESVGQLINARRPATLRMLDLGTGLADIPRTLVTWARQRNLPITITAVDGNPRILDLARAACRDWPEIKLEQQDMRTMPYAAESFDLVLCSLALHHFSEAEAVALLRRIRELARFGYIVNDLRRNWLAIAATRLVTLAPLKSRAFRHDALLSSRAAFTVDELMAMAQTAGLVDFEIDRQSWFFRMTLKGKK